LSCNCNKDKVLKISRRMGVIPQYQTEHSAGMDLHSVESKDIQPMERVLIDTGLRIQIPEGYEAQIRPRSGLAWKHGITVLNSPGTIDADYRGDLKVMLINLSTETYRVNVNDRIAQMVIAPYAKVMVEEVISLDNSERGEGGFGSTGN